MKKPENVLETKEYIKPYTFENDQEAILFYAYLEQEKYIKHLEEQLTVKPSSLKLEEKEIPSFITWLRLNKYTTDEYGFILDKNRNEYFRKDIESIYKDKYNL